MCVIIYKPKGIEVPSLDVLKKCWDANGHGAGFAWRDGFVTVVKGIMNWKQFKEIIERVRDGLKDYDMVLHFRLTSKGTTTALMTHPFVLGEQPSKAVFKTKESVLFHNGTLSGFGNAVKSDTCECAEWLGQLKKRGLKNTDVINILSKLDRSDRFVIMSPRRVYLLGSWEERYGCRFSNVHWEWKGRVYSGNNWYQEYFRGGNSNSLYGRWNYED